MVLEEIMINGDKETASNVLPVLLERTSLLYSVAGFTPAIQQYVFKDRHTSFDLL